MHVYVRLIFQDRPFHTITFLFAVPIIALTLTLPLILILTLTLTLQTWHGQNVPLSS